MLTNVRFERRNLLWISRAFHTVRKKNQSDDEETQNQTHEAFCFGGTKAFLELMLLFFCLGVPPESRTRTPTLSAVKPVLPGMPAMCALPPAVGWGGGVGE